MNREKPPYLEKENWDEVNDLRQQAMDNFSERNKEKLREIERVIASVVVFSKDGKLLMGKKDPAAGGVYPDAWHLPGGGVKPGETLPQAAVREANAEAVGLSLTETDLVELPGVDYGETEKTLASKEKVWCKMEFHRFEVYLNKTAEELKKLTPGEDLGELGWFNPEEQKGLKRAAGQTKVYSKDSTSGELN